VAKRAYAKRYSQAIFEIALEADELDRWQADLDEVAGTIGGAEVLAMLENPKWHVDDKAKLLSENLGDINPKALNLVHLLLLKGRLGMIGEIADGYHGLLDNHRGIEQAEVVTAIELDDRDKEMLVEQLSTIVGKKVVLQTRVDPALIGGIVARIGGRLLDGSTRSKLEALKKDLVGMGR